MEALVGLCQEKSGLFRISAFGVCLHEFIEKINDTGPIMFPVCLYGLPEK